MDTFEQFLQKRISAMMERAASKRHRNQLPSLNQLTIALRQVAADDPTFPDTPERESYLTGKPFPRQR